MNAELRSEKWFYDLVDIHYYCLCGHDCVCRKCHPSLQSARQIVIGWHNSPVKSRRPSQALEPNDAKKLKGAWAEALAATHLELAGLRILQRNYRVRGGEIDLIAVEPLGVTVFLEVKQRASDSHGAAGEFINARKAALVRRAALHYLGRDDLPCRFDAVLIEGRDASTARVQWLQDAF